MDKTVFLKRFSLLILLTWIIPPIFGLSFLVFIGMFTLEEIGIILTRPIEPVYILLTITFSFWYFRRYIRPVYRFLEDPETNSGKSAASCVAAFPLHYWTVFLIYLLAAPATVIISAELYAGYEAQAIDWFRIHLVALIVSIIVGLPIFFLIFDLFGKALGRYELQKPLVTIRTKVFLIGALVPLLIDTMLVQYYWTRTGYFSFETFIVWIVLELLAITGSLIFAHSFGQSLHPLQALAKTTTLHGITDEPSLRAQSTDELGVLTSSYRQLLRDFDVQQHILDIGNTVLRSSTDETGLEDVAEIIVALCHRSIGDDLMFLILYDADQEKLLGVAMTGAPYSAEGYFYLDLDEQSLVVSVFNKGQTLATSDTRNDPRVNPIMIQRYNIKSVIAAPLVNEGKVIGVLVSSNTQRYREYSAREVSLIEGLAQDAALAVQKQIASEQQRIIDQELGLATRVFEDTQEGIMVTDANMMIIRVNKAFTTITGYEGNEAIGQTPQFLSSELEDKSFYQGMWDSIVEKGVWQGEIRNRRKNGELLIEWLNISAARDNSGKVVYYIGIFADITERKMAEERIYHLAHFDALTDLPNRALFFDRLKQLLHQAKRYEKQLAVLFIDLDHFKRINDTLGHVAGDELLVIVAKRLVKCVRETDTVARLGGDEFVILLSAMTHSEDAITVAKHILTEVSKPAALGSQEVHSSASIGISLYPTDGDDATTLFKNADMAMYRAKEQGRNKYNFFTSDMNVRAIERLQMESELHRSVENNEFILHYQPQLDLQTNRITGIEALIRWQHPRLGLLYPESFIYLAEESGAIQAMGDWMLREACQWYQAGKDSWPSSPTLAINLSAQQFLQSDLPKMIEAILDETGMPANLVEFELTETVLLAGGERNLDILTKLKGLGCRIALDDFGTGYSSLSYLKKFPIDTVKIDRSFIRDISDDADDAAIVSAVIAMAENLQLTAIAEGVETDAQFAFLRQYGCHSVQGFLISKPLSAEDAHQWLSEYRVD